MFKNGEPQTIVIDDYFPCDSDNEPCFSKANGNELWVMLLEKAWAKIHGSYERIIGGQAHLTFRDLTGAPSFEFETTDKDAFERIMEGEKRDYAMAAGINPIDAVQAKKISDLGLITEHSYGLISAVKIKDKKGKNVDLVLLRNPWGNFEWNGDWGDNSDCWTPALKKQLNLSEDPDDGLFWMSFEDMKQYFGRVQIGKIQDDYKFNHFKCTGNYTHNLIKTKVNKAGEYTFSVSQIGQRMFKRSFSETYKYANCRMILLKLKNDKDHKGGVSYIQGQKGYEDREAHMECKKLEKGVYYFYVEMDWPQSTATEHRVVNITNYGCADV